MESPKPSKKQKIALIIFSFFIFGVFIYFTSVNRIASNKFRVVNDILYVDADQNYYFQSVILHPKSPHTYYIDQIIDAKTEKISYLKDVLDIEHIHAIGSNYYSDGSKIIYPPVGARQFAQILDIDASNYTYFGNAHAWIKDNKNVYYFDQLIVGADGQSFNIINMLTNTNDIDDLSLHEIGYDDHHLFDGANIMSLKVLKILNIHPLWENLLIRRYFTD